MPRCAKDHCCDKGPLLIRRTARISYFCEIGCGAVHIGHTSSHYVVSTIR